MPTHKQSHTPSYGSDLYYSLLKIKPQQAEAVVLLQEFHHTLQKIILDCRELMVTQAKLQWWRQELAHAFQQKASHPLMQALQIPIKTFQLNQNYFLEMINGVETYLNAPRLVTQDDFFSFTSRSLGACNLLIHSVFEKINKETLSPIYQLSAGIATRDYLQKLSTQLAQGYFFLSEESYIKHDLNLEDLVQNKKPEEINNFIQEQATQGLEYLNNNTYLIKPFRVQANLAKLYLSKAQQSPELVLKQSIRITPLKKLWTAWTTQ